jgi:hypothetical protein
MESLLLPPLTPPLHAIRDNVRGISFWVEGNSVRKGEPQLEPWAWSVLCANCLKAALSALQHLEANPESEACCATVVCEEQVLLQIKPRSPVSAQSIAALRSHGASISDMEETLYWLWETYHSLDIDHLLSDPVFPRVLGCLVKADSGRDWSVKPGVFKDIIRDILIDIIDREDKSTCLNIVGLPPDESFLSFKPKSPAYSYLEEALQLIEIAAETRLSDLINKQRSWLRTNRNR